jgi:hypothetical protein
LSVEGPGRFEELVGQPVLSAAAEGAGQSHSAGRRARRLLLDAVAEGVFAGGVEVEVVGGGAAGKSDVAAFLAEGLVGEHEAGVDGAALGFVQGHGVAVVEVPAVEPGLVEEDSAPVGELDDEAVATDGGADPVTWTL